MAKIIGCMLLFAALGAGQAVAGANPPHGTTVIGKVRDFYLRVAQHVYLERSSGLVPRGAVPDFWVDVELAGDAAQGRQFALARLGEVRGVEIGDLVEVDLPEIDLRVAARMRRGVAPLAREDRVLAIAAKHLTPMARQFGRPARAPSHYPRIDLTRLQ